MGLWTPFLSCPPSPDPTLSPGRDPALGKLAMEEGEDPKGHISVWMWGTGV